MAETKTTSSRAWLLDFGRGLQAAVGANEMSHIFLTPTLYKVPGTPFYADEIFVFQEDLIPVVDVLSLLDGRKNQYIRNDVLGLGVYQPSAEANAHLGGLRLTVMPSNIFVEDTQFCELPPELAFWSPLALSCFMLNETAVPIIDFAVLFSGRLTSDDFMVE